MAKTAGRASSWCAPRTFVDERVATIPIGSRARSCSGSVLLVYASEIKSSAVSASFRVAPIGLFLICGYLKAHGLTVRILHLSASRLKRDGEGSERYRLDMEREIRQFGPHVIGFSFRNLFHWGDPDDPTRLMSYLSVAEEKPVVEFLRSTSPAPIVGGGAAFSLAPQLYMNTLGLDYGIVGEGEKAFFDLVRALKGGDSAATIPGLIRRDGNTLTASEPQAVRDLATMPPIDLGGLSECRALYYENGGYIGIQTKRGCGFHCIYCTYPFLEGSRYRLRSVRTILEEMECLRKYHDIRHYFFVDSVFSTPVEHSLAICREISRRRLDVEWNAYVNPRGLTKEVLRTYRDSGCHNLVLTPDALSERVLRSYGKEFNLDDVKWAVDSAQRMGLLFEVSLIVGGPGEDEVTVEETIDFCDAYLADVPIIIFDGMWIHPRSPVCNVAVSEGIFDSPSHANLHRIVRDNDFEANRRLTYFFPHIERGRDRFIADLHARLRRKKRVVVSKDLVPDPKTGERRHHPELGVMRNQRPWHKGMTGRG